MGVTQAIAVTGAGGFIGRKAMSRLAAAFGEVVGIDLVPRPAGWEGRWLQGGVERLLEVETPFVAVHLAWNMRRSDTAAQAAALEDFRKMLAVPGRVGLVGLGSAEEYGSEEGCLAEDRAPGAALSPYGRAKHEALRAAEAAGGRFIWLRPFIVYGEGQGGGMAIPYALRCAREGRIAEFSEGSQFRDFVHADDVAAGIVAAVRAVCALREGTGGICNLGCGKPVKLRDVLERIAARTGRERLFRFGVRPMRAGEPRVQYADAAAAKETLGWEAEIPWQEGIDRLCRDAEEKA